MADQTLTVNGTTYTTGAGDGVTELGMADGGFRDNLFPMLDDTIVEMQARLDAAGAALRASSTTSASIGSGSKSLTIQTGKGFSVGDWVIAFDTSNPTTQWMVGQVTTYTTATGALVFTVAAGDYVGSATIVTWTVALSAQPGPTGPTGPDGPTGPAPVIKTTSTTSLSIGTGTKAFTTAATLALQLNDWIFASSQADPSKWMLGQISSLAGTALEISVASGDANGSGTVADWNLTLSAPRGATGAAGTMPGWSIKTANYTVVNGDRVFADMTGGAWTLQLPASASAGHEFELMTYGANLLSLDRNGLKIAGIADDGAIPGGSNTHLRFVYLNATYGWVYGGAP